MIHFANYSASYSTWRSISVGRTLQFADQHRNSGIHDRKPAV
jgi:hypothetical protein